MQHSSNIFNYLLPCNTRLSCVTVCISVILIKKKEEMLKIIFRYNVFA